MSNQPRGQDPPPRSGLTFRLEGPGADTAARELEDLLGREFAAWPCQREQRQRPGDPERGEPVTLTVIAIALAVPSAVQTTWDLAQRLQIKQKVERLLQWARGKAVQDPGHRVMLSKPGGAVPLDQARVDEIVNALHEMTDRGGR